MPPGSTFHHISFRSTILVSYLLLLQSFTFQSINQKYQKYYFTVYLSLSDLTFASNREGINNPFIALGACLFDCVCRYSVGCALSPTWLIPWFSKLGEILVLLCCITLSSSRKKPTHAQEVALLSPSLVLLLCSDLATLQLTESAFFPGMTPWNRMFLSLSFVTSWACIGFPLKRKGWCSKVA